MFASVCEHLGVIECCFMCPCRNACCLMVIDAGLAGISDMAYPAVQLSRKDKCE